MQNYFDNNYVNSATGLTRPSHLDQEEINEVIKARGKVTQDTVAAARVSAKAKQVEVGTRPALPQPAGKSQNANYLALVAEAFSKAYDSMSGALTSQVDEYNQLQQLNQTMAKEVLTSTKDAISSQMKNAKLAAKIAAYQKASAASASKWGEITEIGGFALMAATILSGFFTGGISWAALPEEGAALAGEVGADAVGEDMTGEAGVELVDLGGDGIADDLDGEVAAINNDAADVEGVGAGNAELNQTAAQTTTEETSSRFGTAKAIAKGFGRMAVATLLGSPMLQRSIQSFHTSKLLDEAAVTEKNAGTAVANMQLINLYAQYYQSQVQRTGGVVQDQTQNASDAIQDFGTVTNAYQRICYGLANAV